MSFTATAARKGGSLVVCNDCLTHAWVEPGESVDKWVGNHQTVGCTKSIATPTDNSSFQLPPGVSQEQMAQFVARLMNGDNPPEGTTATGNPA